MGLSKHLIYVLVHNVYFIKYSAREKNEPLGNEKMPMLGAERWAVFGTCHAHGTQKTLVPFCWNDEDTYRM